MTKEPPGLTRAIHAAASPRQGGHTAGYERAGALRERRRLYVAAFSIVLSVLLAAFFFGWEAHNAAGVTYSHWGILGKPAGDDYDEGAYVISAQLLQKGYHLFDPVVSAQPALFLPAMVPFLALISEPLAAGHIYEASFGLLALAGVAWMAWTAYRPLATPLAVLLLAVSPGFLLYAHTVESEMPMLGACALAVASAQAYFLTRRRSLAALAGLLLFAGSEMKLLSAVVILPMALLLLGGAWSGYRSGKSMRAIAGDAGIFLAVLVVPALVVLGALSPRAQWDQVVTFHLQASKHVAWEGATNLQALGVFLSYDPGLLVAAATGALLVVSGARTSNSTRFIVLAHALWFISMVVFFWRYQPLIQHQFVPLLAPLAVLGAGLVGVPLRLSAPFSIARRSRRAPMVAPPADGRVRAKRLPVRAWLAALALIAYAAVFAARTANVDAHIFATINSPSRDYLVALLKSHTRPSDLVVSDDPMVALEAGRLLPPEMDDPSIVRLQSGYLNATQARAVTTRYHVAAVVARRLSYVHNQLKGTILSYYLPDYLNWVGQHYRRLPVPARFTASRVYVRR